MVRIYGEREKTLMLTRANTSLDIVHHHLSYFNDPNHSRSSDENAILY